MLGCGEVDSGETRNTEIMPSGELLRVSRHSAVAEVVVHSALIARGITRASTAQRELARVSEYGARRAGRGSALVLAPLLVFAWIAACDSSPSFSCSSRN